MQNEGLGIMMKSPMQQEIRTEHQKLSARCKVSSEETDKDNCRIGRGT